MSCREALNIAQDQDLDLVLVAEKAQPPVVRIIDHGRWKYEQDKLKKEHKKKKPQEVKGITLRPGTAEHDLQVIVRKAIKFLNEGDKVRLVCRFRQRELAHPEVGKGKLLIIAERLADLGKPDRDPILNGREMVLLINPKPATGGVKKNVKAEEQASDEVENQQNGGEEVQNLGNGEDHATEVS